MAAKMSGSYNETAGYFRQKIGQLLDDTILNDSGRNQQLLGKIHRLVGTLRSARTDLVERVKAGRIESTAICFKHGGRLLDVASDFIEDMKKVILK